MTTESAAADDPTVTGARRRVIDALKKRTAASTDDLKTIEGACHPDDKSRLQGTEAFYLSNPGESDRIIDAMVALRNAIPTITDIPARTMAQRAFDGISGHFKELTAAEAKAAQTRKEKQTRVDELDQKKKNGPLFGSGR